tara:strand:- start:63246 stop:63950 length:705 start_codon:yes stop_codon:yes gene_type:complete
MSEPRIYFVHWVCKPGTVELPDEELAGAMIIVHLIGNDIRDAIEKSKQIAIDSGWIPEPIPYMYSLHFQDEMEFIGEEYILEGMQRVIEDGPWISIVWFSQDDELYDIERSKYIWLLDWEAENVSDERADGIVDAHAHMAVFLRCEGLAEAVDEGYDWISSMGWIPDDEPSWAEQLCYSDIDDRVHPQYQFAALEAFRDGHSMYFQMFAQADGYPDRVFPLCYSDDEDEEFAQS